MKNELFGTATKIKDAIIGMDVTIKDITKMSLSNFSYCLKEIPESTELFENFKKELITICLAKKEELEADFNNL